MIHTKEDNRATEAKADDGLKRAGGDYFEISRIVQNANIPKRILIATVKGKVTR